MLTLDTKPTTDLDDILFNGQQGMPACQDGPIPLLQRLCMPGKRLSPCVQLAVPALNDLLHRVPLPAAWGQVGLP